MANVLNKLNVNSVAFDIVDKEGRNSINNLENTKLNKFETKEPLSLYNNVLSIDLSAYCLGSELENRKEELLNTIDEQAENRENKLEKIYSLFKHIFGSYITTDNLGLSFNDEIPSLKNYDKELNETRTNLENLSNRENEHYTEVNEDISNKYSEITTSIKNLTDVSSTEIDSLKNRCTNLEDEVFGTLYSKSTEHENFVSRLDDMEAKINKVYEALTNIGIIKE